MRKIPVLPLAIVVASLIALPVGIANSQETGEQLNLAEANVMGVNYSRSGADREFRFNVTLYHDDDGEGGYANWWQVETLDGEQLGRRDLLHAHGTREFTRSDTVKIPEETRYVVVRGHDETHGYGGRSAIVDLNQEEIELLDQGSEPDDFTDYTEARTVEMESYSNEKFGFKISYPKDWEKNLPKEEEKSKPGDDREITFHAASSKVPEASVFVTANETDQSTNLDEFKQYMELQKKLFPGAGFDEIYRGKLAGFPVVVTKYSQSNYELNRGDKNGTEITWAKNSRKGKSIGLINDGYLYRVFVSANSEDFEEANEMYFEKILNSFEILSG